MKLRDLSDVACLLSVHGHRVINADLPIAEEVLDSYWTLSRTRMRYWLKALPGSRECETPLTPSKLIALVQEVLVSEMVTRLWTAILVARDRAQGQREAEPVARRAFLLQLEARQRVLTLLTTEHALPPGGLESLDRLRRQVERWTDVLLGPYAVRYGVGEFAFCQQRAADFGEDLGTRTHRLQAVRHVIPASLRASLPTASIHDPARRTIQKALVNVQLSVFPESCFKSHPPASPLTLRSEPPLPW